MAFIIVLLTLAMVLTCVILVLLVLIQLPKKEAGGVLAFGGGGADALFGAGSGTMLTKITSQVRGARRSILRPRTATTICFAPCFG